MMEERLFGELKYLISFPKGFEEGKKYPLVIYLHGAGSRGESTEVLRQKSTTKSLLEHQDERGYILLEPLCKSGNWYEWMEVLIRWVESFRETSYIDKTRIYLTGNSMGGYGTWALANLRPYWFAAIMPICGGGIGGFAINLKNLPIRAFHGLQDTTVDPIESLQMAKAVNMKGGRAELILYPECAHNCWDAAYSDDKNYDWMFSFTASPEEPEIKDLSTTIYGNKKNF